MLEGGVLGTTVKEVSFGRSTERVTFPSIDAALEDTMQISMPVKKTVSV